MVQSATAVIEASRDRPVGERAEPFDMYTAYCEKFGATYGADKCPTREQWDAMCKQPRTTQRLTDDQFDDNQFSLENGDGEIY